MVFTYLASFTGYKDNIFKVISKLHVEISKFGGKIDNFGVKYFEELNSIEVLM